MFRQALPAMIYAGAKRTARELGDSASPFIGETEGAVAGDMGSTVAGAAVGAGTLGAGIATANPLLMAQGAGMLGKEAINLPGKLLEWTEALLKSKEAIGQFNQVIASAQASAELRGVQRAFQSGQRTGGAYSNLSDAYQDFQDTVQPMKDSAFNAISRDVANGVRDLTTLVGHVRSIAEWIGIVDSQEEEDKKLLAKMTPFQDTVAGIKAGGFAAQNESGEWAIANLEGGQTGAGLGGLPAGWGREPPGGRAGGHFDKPPTRTLGPEQLKLQWADEDAARASKREKQKADRAATRPQETNDAQVDFDDLTRKIEAAQKEQDVARANRRVQQLEDVERAANVEQGQVGGQGQHRNDPNQLDPEGQMPDVQPRMPPRFRDRSNQTVPKVRPQPKEEEKPGGISWIAAGLLQGASAGTLGVPYLISKFLQGQLQQDTKPPNQQAGNIP